MNLYIRKKGLWVNYIHNIDEFKEFEEIYIPGRIMIIGDLSWFTKPMLYRLLKLIEEHPEIDCFSSKDVQDPILLSRFMNIIKEPLLLTKTHDVQNYKESAKDYTSAESLMVGLSYDMKLRLPLMSASQLELINSL